MLFTESIRQKIFVGLLFFVMSGLALAALIIPSPLRPSISSLEVGQVAPQDIVAPKAISYESAVLTAKQRDTAARAVTPVYAPLDTDVARRQVSRLRNALDFISSVRADQYATSEQKLADLTALEDFKFQKGSDEKILALSDARWQTVQQETINVLEQVMRSIIRENRLEEARRSVPALVSLSLPEEQAEVVAELAVAFVAPNSLYSEALTEQARQQASKDAQPVIRSYVAGETIVPRGKVINDADIEALQELGLTQPEKHWQDYIGAAGLVIVITAFLVLYLSRRPRLRQDPRAILLIAILFWPFCILPG
jgi:membrane-associated HD superfamily phosphohydrolase